MGDRTHRVSTPRGAIRHARCRAPMSLPWDPVAVKRQERTLLDTRSAGPETASHDLVSADGGRMTKRVALVAALVLASSAGAERVTEVNGRHVHLFPTRNFAK